MSAMSAYRKGRPFAAYIYLEEINRVFDQLGVARPEASELEPLQAA